MSQPGSNLGKTIRLNPSKTSGSVTGVALHQLTWCSVCLNLTQQPLIDYGLGTKILRHIRNILCNMHVSLKWRQNIRSWWTLQIGSSSSAEMKEYNQWHKCSWWLEKVIVLAAVRPNCRFRIATTISCKLRFYKLHIDNTQVLTSWNRFLSGRNGSF